MPGPSLEAEAGWGGVLRTRRLDLIPLSVAAIEALLAGGETAASAITGVSLAPGLGERSHRLLELRRADLRSAPAAAPWLLRVIALRGPGPTMVGLVGFHGPPDITGTVEVGYEVDPPYRRRGYASEATVALVTWALGDGGARRVIAGIRPGNVASMRVVARLGFTPAGSRWDGIEGTVRLFERRSPPPAAEWEDARTHAHPSPWQRPGIALRPEAPEMTDDATYHDIYPGRDAAETRSIADRLRSIFGGHRADPDDPGHRCLCGYDGESFDDHLAESTLREMGQAGYEVWPVRHG